MRRISNEGEARGERVMMTSLLYLRLIKIRALALRDHGKALGETSLKLGRKVRSAKRCSCIGGEIYYGGS